jgi:hypothetical protein
VPAHLRRGGIDAQILRRKVKTGTVIVGDFEDPRLLVELNISRKRMGFHRIRNRSTTGTLEPLSPRGRGVGARGQAREIRSIDG